MFNFVQEVHWIKDWALVTVKPGHKIDARMALTLSAKTKDDNKIKVLYQYRTLPDDDTKLLIPRALVGHMYESIPEENREEGFWLRAAMHTKLLEPRPGQLETIDEFMHGLAHKGRFGGILQAVTGAGKTVMALDIMTRLDYTTLIVVPRTSLMEQWRKQVMKWTSVKASEIGIIQGTKQDWSAKKVVIAMIHTLAQQHDKFNEFFYSYFGTVIFDECHVVGAETFSRVAPLFNCRYRIGLSATPRRADGMDPVFYWHIGPILARFTKLQAEARVRILPYRGADTAHTGCVWAGKLNLGRYFNRVAKSPKRLEMVLKILLALAPKDHDILVLADRVQYLKTLKALLISNGVDESKIGLLIGEVKQLDRKIILGTYGSAGMGVDIPRLSALVLATPRADIEQAVGRVLRQGSPIVVDIVDTKSSIMVGWSMSRKKYYRKITKDIQDRSLNYT